MMGAPRYENGRNAYVPAGRGGGRTGWGNKGGCWGAREVEVNPFGSSDIDGPEEIQSEQESSGINFDAYEDIPVEAEEENVPPPVNTFAEMDLGELSSQIHEEPPKFSDRQVSTWWLFMEEPRFSNRRSLIATYVSLTNMCFRLTRNAFFAGESLRVQLIQNANLKEQMTKRYVRISSCAYTCNSYTAS